MTRSTLLASSLMAGAALASCSPQEAATAVPVSAPETAYTLTPVAEGLEFPWGITPLPDGAMLVTEREGRIQLVSADGTMVPVSGGPETLVAGQGGYFGMVLGPDFAIDRLVYLSFAKGTEEANSTAVFRARLSEDGTALENGETIYEADLRDTTYHFGGRLAFMPDGTLLVSLGDGFRYKDDAQKATVTHGAIVRINADGTIPADNPFVGTAGAAEEIYTIGHRNVQGLLVDEATGAVFATEHGPKGGDELNLIVPGNNYGWPVITYGVNYDGTVISSKTEAPGMEQPLAKWVPSIAPSGLIRYTGSRYPELAGTLLVGGMNGPAGQKLVALRMDGTSVTGETHYLTGLERPIRDIAEAGDGTLYVVTHELDGGLYRIDPAG